MANILIADDHAVVRRGLREIIEERSSFHVVAEAGSSAEVINALSRESINIVILDINMPGKNGLDILVEIRQTWKTLPVLILSMHPEEQFATRLFKAGASGYITKESAPDMLLSAIDTVMAGRKYVSPSFSQQLVNELQRERETPRHELLSDREFQVLCLLASGKTVTEVGLLLSLSAKTISTYRGRILEKMDMKTNAQLTHYVIQHGLLG